ncbi:polymer-forming cytoskeletal family protein [Helicobacter didelphidarum]|uniref:Polymer-forming cytoskeletal family protein n=1 Tax=Helicobacter didelphidarum TaxID=2040648 RepID=A0A3D8INM7_9HELI|nr:polymer-forming cytoskeletal protein [Helicobacter didelphidarum]RDU66822.1 polymer-forming cytoskeletal family protein [Helicobacter didelphidarum]
MAFFAGDNKQPNGKETGAATIIAANTRFKGEITTDCHFHTDGEFEGTIHSKNTVMVGKTGLIIGDVYAQKVIISGRVTGNVEAKTIEILANGRLEGAITSDELVIERKGMFLGQSKNNIKDGIQVLPKEATPSIEIKK